jgi:Cu(I)/Ag(I) efflux system membrane fusion protein
VNNKARLVASVAAVLVLAGGYGLYRLGMNRGMAMGGPMSGSAHGATGDVRAGAAVDPATGKRVLYWHDPMVPGQKFDQPGKSPFMDMPLVPVYADAAGNDNTVSISARVQQNLGIRTAEVAKGRLSAPIEAVGSVAYNEREVALVQARGNGFVERLHVRAPLEPVRKGQPLAELYVPDWVAAQEEYLSVRRMAAAGGELLDGARQRMRLAGMTDDQIRLVESTGRAHPRLTITAPIAGVIAELGAREGLAVTMGAPLFRINGLGTVWVNAEVPESVAAAVRPGSAVEARTPALPGSVFKGKVSALLPEVNPLTRTVKARIELANPGAQLVPGMFASIKLSPAQAKEVLLVPSEAVIQTGTRTVVMVAQGEGGFAPVEVEVGTEANGQSEIRKGLEAGQKVVVSGQFLIDSEASLRGTATRMGQMPAPGAAPEGPLHRGQGKVEQIGKDEITLSHGPIPTLQWAEMTMGFKLPPGGLPRNIAVGSAVTFTIRPTPEGAYQIMDISPTPQTPKGDSSNTPMTHGMTGAAKPGATGPGK